MEKKRSGSNKNKIPKILQHLHKDVHDVQMQGLNSERRQTVDFVVSERASAKSTKGNHETIFQHGTSHTSQK